MNVRTKDCYMNCWNNVELTDCIQTFHQDWTEVSKENVDHKLLKKKFESVSKRRDVRYNFKLHTTVQNLLQKENLSLMFSTVFMSAHKTRKKNQPKKKIYPKYVFMNTKIEN